MLTMQSKILFSAGTISLLMTLPVYAAPQDDGSWGAVFDWPFRGAVSTLLTPEGNILSIGLTPNATNWLFESWNPELGTGTGSRTNANVTLSSPDANGFRISGTPVLLPGSSKVLLPGVGQQGFSAENITYTFNTQTNSLNRVANSNNYQDGLSVILPTGEILINTTQEGEETRIPEIYSPETNQWRLLSGAQLAQIRGVVGPVFSTRSGEWVNPDGNVIVVGDANSINPRGNGNVTSYQDPTTAVTLTNSPVMFRPGKILYVPRSDEKPFIVNINASAPTVRKTSTFRASGALAGKTVLLPNGKVMSLSSLSTTGNSLQQRTEIWDPATEIWSTVATVNASNRYLTNNTTLLKDGRVFTNLSVDFEGQLFTAQARIFSPPYLFDNSGQLAQRPEIVNAPANAAYGGQVNVQHGAGNVISRATLITSSRTNFESTVGQRFIELTFDDLANGVSVKMPTSANIAPPGHYILYLIDNKGVPSKGHIINISAVSQTAGAYPTATADFANAVGSGLITINALANDNGTGLVLNKPNAWSQKGGSVSLVNNKITYKPKAGFNGTDKIWYVFRDSRGRTNNGEITISVSGNEVASSPYPTAKQDYVTTTTSTKITIDVLANDTGSGLVLNAPNVWSLSGGRVGLVSNKLVYTPKTGFTGSDRIWYTFKDSQGRSNSGQVNITIKSGSTTAFPVAKADYYTTNKGIGKVLDILANDTTSGGKAIDTLYSYTAKGGWTNKTSSGKVWYKPKAGFTGEDNFWYVIIDAQGRKNSAQVKINVQ